MGLSHWVSQPQQSCPWSRPPQAVSSARLLAGSHAGVPDKRDLDGSIVIYTQQLGLADLD